MPRASARAAGATLIAVLLSSLGMVTGPALADTTDVTPPAQVSNVQITPYYQTATVHLTPPTDPDYNNFLYAVAPGSDAPSRQFTSWETSSAFNVIGLSMGTDYTLAVWTQDKSWNTSDPVLTHFTTLLDSEPPHSVAGLTVTGGAYKVAASWSPPTDSDLQSLTATLTDDATGTASSRTLGKTAVGYTWRLPGGKSYTVSVTATDIHGLVSDVSSATAQTDPDANGAPPPLPPSTVSFVSTGGALWVSFPRPTIPDLAGLAYAVTPLGQDPQSVTTFESVDITSPDIGFGIYAPPTFQVEGGQLILRVTDLNGNSTVSAVPGLRAAAHPLLVPPAPTAVTVTSPADGALDVGWTAPSSSNATSWTITAVSGPFSEVMTVPGQARQAQLTALAGQRNWTVDVSGRNDNGSGGGRTADPVPVTGADAPPPVTNAASTPDYDVQMLTWRNPTSPDFDHVEITQLAGSTAETRVVYRGRGPFARVRGFAPGHGYTFEIRSYDRLHRAGGVAVIVRTEQATVSLSMFSGPINPGEAVAANGQLDGNYGYPLGGQPVILESRPAGSANWRRAPLAGTTLPSFGAFQPLVHPLVTTEYRLAFKGSHYYGGGYSPVSTVFVRSSSQAAALSFLRSLRRTAWLW